jgi:hypothetical protein
LNFMKLSFQWAIICMKRVPNKRVVPILLRRCNLSKVISDAQHSMFLPYLLVRVFKIDDSWCVGKKVWRRFWILAFLPFYISKHVLKSWWKQRLLSQAFRWLMTLIAIDQELMGTFCHAYKTNQMHILPPGWWSGVETIANKPNASLRP